MIRIAAVGLLVGMVASVAACSGTAPTPIIVYVTPPPTVAASPSASPTEAPTKTILGFLKTKAYGSLTAEEVNEVNADASLRCHNKAGLVADTTDVLVMNESGETIGKAKLKAGYPKQDYYCNYVISVVVPATATFYKVEVGKFEGPTWSREELEASDWMIDDLVVDTP